MKNFNKNTLVWLALALAGFMLFNIYTNQSDGPVAKEWAYSELIAAAERGDVAEVNIRPDQKIISKTKSGEIYKTQSPLDLRQVERFMSQNVKVVAVPQEEESFFMKLLASSLPLLLIIAFWFFALRHMQGGSGNRGFGFNKNRTKLVSDTKRVSFKDVAGAIEAKKDVEEVVDFLRSPQKYQRLGAKIPRGVLLVGPPGTGKTLLARAVAGEAKVPFFSISGSDFVEVFVGVGASRVREMFEQGRKHSPCIIFIDEIDAVGRQRGGKHGGGNDEREQTLNQLLVEMDGMEANDNVIIMAATNRADVLDKALLRPGRFDRQVHVDLPNQEDRLAILNVHTQKVPLEANVNLQRMAAATVGFSGAQLANLVNEAALYAARRDAKYVGFHDFEVARDKLLMGPARTSAMHEDEKKMTAYHEAGHALIAYLHRKFLDPIHKATILPRGNALGMVQYVPERDMKSTSRKKILCYMAMAFGGRAAEEIFFGKDNVSTGAASDIKQATNYAMKYVTVAGLSEEIGPIHYELDRYGEGAIVSPETQNLIDNEVKKLLTAAMKEAHELIIQYKEQLIAVAKALLQYETITGEEIADLIEGRPIREEEAEATPAPQAPRPSDNDAESEPETEQPDVAPQPLI